MLGLMMNSQLTLTSVMRHAGRFHGDAEVVSVTADQPLHRYRYRDCFARAAQLAHALQALGASAATREGVAVAALTVLGAKLGWPAAGEPCAAPLDSNSGGGPDRACGWCIEPNTQGART